MSEGNFFYDISEETVASWIDGTMTPEQEAEFMQGLAEDNDLSEILDSLDDVESSFETLIEDGYELPEEILYDDFEVPDVTMPEDIVMFDDDAYNAEHDSDDSTHYGDYSTRYVAEHEDENAIDDVGYNEIGHDMDDDSSMADDAFDMMF